MSNPSKQKGTRAETKVVRYIMEHGIEAKRKALKGNKDEGDIELPQLGISLEVKAGKQTANYNRSQLSEWLDQADVEQKNAHQPCYLVIARHNRSVSDYEVWKRKRPSEKDVVFCYLDDWVQEKARILATMYK